MKIFRNVLIINLIIAVVLYIGAIYYDMQPTGIFGGLSGNPFRAFFSLMGAIIHTILEVIGVIIYWILKEKLSRINNGETTEQKELYEQWRRDATKDDYR